MFKDDTPVSMLSKIVYQYTCRISNSTKHWRKKIIIPKRVLLSIEVCYRDTVVKGVMVKNRRTFTLRIKVSNFAVMFVLGYLLRKKYGLTWNSNPDVCWCYKGAEYIKNLQLFIQEIKLHEIWYTDVKLKINYFPVELFLIFAIVFE